MAFFTNQFSTACHFLLHFNHNYIYFYNFHVDGLAFQISQIVDLFGRWMMLRMEEV
jgi:hypothetical protein